MQTPKPDPERNLLIATPVARPMPKRGLLTRRVFMIGSFWSGLLAAVVGLLGAPLDFMWPRKLEAFGGTYVVPAAEVPPEGGEPVRFPSGRFYLSHLAPGQEGSQGGILAIYQKCTHLGCTVPWRPEFMFNDVRGWYRCPCHGSTYTRGAAILVSGPAPRPLDTMQVEVNGNGDVVVDTGRITKGATDSPQRVVPYKAANQTGVRS